MKKQLKSENSALLALVLKKYAALTEDEIKQLVTGKWTSSFGNRLANEIQCASQSINSTLVALQERYEQTLPEINAEVEQLKNKVKHHLKTMEY